MKRPQGFDRTGADGSGPFATVAGRVSRAEQSRAEQSRAEQPSAEGTSVITLGEDAASQPGVNPRVDPNADTAQLPVIDGGTRSGIPAAAHSASARSWRATRRSPAQDASAASGDGDGDTSRDTGSERGSESDGNTGADAARLARRAGRERKRFERGEVRRFTRRSRRRRLIWLISLGCAVLVLGGVVLAAFSPLMALRSIEVVGAVRLKPAAVAAALDGQLGTPLPLIDFGEVKKDLAHFPLIRSFSTETHPPGTLVVRIVERQPVGVLKTSKGYELVDPAGVVIERSAQRPAGYPVIELTGAPRSAAAAPGFAAAAAVLVALPDGVAAQVDSVAAKTKDDVTLTLLSGQSVLWGDADQSGLKAADLAALLKDAPGVSVYDVSAPQSPVTR